MTDIVEQMEVAVQAAVEDMPYRWLGPNYPDERGVEIYDTLREFFENTWQSDNADAVFKDAAAAAVQAILPFIEAAKAEARREMREEAVAAIEGLVLFLKHAKALSRGQFTDNIYVCKQRLDDTYRFLTEVLTQIERKSKDGNG